MAINVLGIVSKAFSEGSHMKKFKDGSVGRLVDYVENGVKKSRLTITHSDGTVVDRLTTRVNELGHKARTSHTDGTAHYLMKGEAYTEGSYKTVDRYYDSNNKLNVAIEGHTTPKYQREYGHFTFDMQGQIPKDIPWYERWMQFADISRGKLTELREGIPSKARPINIPVTEDLRKEYAVLEEIANRPMNLLDRTY